MFRSLLKIHPIEWALILLPIISFAIYIYSYAINVPLMDDMNLIQTINDFTNPAENPLKVLSGQINDHRIFFAKTAAVVGYLLFGRTNFEFTILLSFANLLLLSFAFLLVYKSQFRSVAGFIPVILLLFTPYIYTAQIWSIPGFQHSLSIGFSLISLFFLQDEKRRIWYWSIPFAVFASYSNLDGLSTFLIGFIWLVLQKRWKNAAIYALFTCLFLFVFFTGYHFSSASRPLPLNELLMFVPKGIIVITGSFVKIISDTYAVILSFVSGCVILLVFLFVKFSLKPAKNPKSSLISRMIDLDIIEIAFIRLLAAAAMISIGRASDGILSMIAARFQLYSVCFFILFYFLVLRIIKNRYLYLFQFSSIIFGILTCIYLYIKYDSAVALVAAELKADSYNYPHHQVYLHQYFNLPDPKPDFYKHYEFPVFFEPATIDSWKTQLMRASSGSTATVSKEHPLRSGIYKDYIYPITSFRIDNIPITLPKKDTYIGFVSNIHPDQFYLAAVRDQKNSGLKGLLNLSGHRVFTTTILNKFPEGTYQMGLCWLEDNKPKVMLVDKALSL